MPPLAAGQSVPYVDRRARPASRAWSSPRYGGRGTLAAYANYEAEPLQSSNIGSSVRPGTNQIITINAPADGKYYFKVTATADAAGVLVRARVL